MSVYTHGTEILVICDAVDILYLYLNAVYSRYDTILQYNMIYYM